MTRYFFHLREGGKLTRDVTGTVLPGLEDAIEHAKRLAFALIDRAGAAGRAILEDTAYEVEEGAGRLALVLPLSHFVEVSAAA